MSRGEGGEELRRSAAGLGGRAGEQESYCKGMRNPITSRSDDNGVCQARDAERLSCPTSEQVPTSFSRDCSRSQNLSRRPSHSVFSVFSDLLTSFSISASNFLIPHHALQELPPIPMSTTTPPLDHPPAHSSNKRRHPTDPEQDISTLLRRLLQRQPEVLEQLKRLGGARGEGR